MRIEKFNDQTRPRRPDWLCNGCFKFLLCQSLILILSSPMTYDGDNGKLSHSFIYLRHASKREDVPVSGVYHQRGSRR
jgi:hypothetical protein